MEQYIGFCDSDGNKIYTSEYVQVLRDRDRNKEIKNTIIAQNGGQTKILSSNANVSFTGGSRGGSKSFSILLEALKDITNPYFRAIILRKEKKDLVNLIEESKLLYSDYGTYISSDKDMYWRLNAGGTIEFSYHAGNIDEFKERFQGRQYAYIAVDEVSQIDLEKFLYLLSSLRNAHGIRNRLVASCNPPRKTHWLRQMLDFYISNEDTVCPKEYRHEYIAGKLNPWFDGQKHPELHGYPIPWLDSTKRYFFFSGAKTVADIKWGETREEVYQKCKSQIDELYMEDLKPFGKPEELFVMSATFVEARLTDNIKLLEADPQYVARLANQDRSQQLADLKGCWDVDGDSEGYVSEAEMEAFLNNPRQYGDGKRRASLDVSYEGGDASVMWLRIGNHFADVAVFRLDHKNLVEAIRQKLYEWGVNEDDLTFDSIGVGQAIIGHFKRAIKFNAQERPYGTTEEEKIRASQEFDILKSQAAFGFADHIKYLEYSIDSGILERRFQLKSGELVRLRDILMEERKILAIDVNRMDMGNGKCIIKKHDMKRMIGRSPDFMESMLYTEIFNIKKKTTYNRRPLGSARFTQPKRSVSIFRSGMHAGRAGMVRYS